MGAINSAENGPLLVNGDVPLERRRQVETEHGEPLAWETTQRVETKDRYALCRCGGSANKPFCDGTHAREGFVADEGDTGSYADRSTDLGGTGITVRDDRSICEHAGYCGNQVTNVWKAVADTGDVNTRTMVIGMIDKCPSGALTYEIDGESREPILPEAIGVIDDGPLWVTGGISITLADGTQLETRNRVTLCRCGQSANKPLCDGSHKEAGFRDSGG
ncbi:MAG: CDGSH iron-sulfur domain-containing protein [Ilumatobacter sp.]|uniref:CDGSH iron-sulfur domain-containing protein n=1 Tax=Ilumatobacter sp. TaxID=1967498 RepID=UPI00260F85ED|nr:CDGSH iron-sulfur domain-containing protein [Ilumatobacter sp.]MDJ0767779.1 CDGSH iron-sulfur domain-containing protein [Ilumatobacter sp.]